MDDLVAELTLRINNQMNAGLEDILGEFGALDDEAETLRRKLVDVGTALDELHVPDGLVSGFSDVATDAEAAITAIDGIGAALDADTTKVQELAAAMGKLPADVDAANAAAGGGGGGNGDGGDNEDGGSASGHGAAHSENPFMGLLALTDAPEAVDQYAEFNSVLGQAVTTEKLHGAAYTAELDRLKDLMDELALEYHVKSQDLADAYKYLITTGMPASEVDALMPSLAEAATAHAIDVTDMRGAVFALADDYKIPPDQMQAVLAQLGYATKEGHFGAEYFGSYLPEIGGALATAGVTGEQAADYSFSALETVVKNASIPSQAATNYVDFIHYIGTQHAERSFLQMSRMMLPQMREIFDKYDVSPADLYGMENQAQAEGKDPVQTVLDYVHDATKNMSPTDRNAVISDFFTNQQGGDAVRSIMLHWDEYQANEKTLSKVDPKTLDDDFQNAVSNVSSGVQQFGENLSQLNRDFGALLNYVVIEPANALISPQVLLPHAPGGGGPSPGLGPMHPYPHSPMELHVIVSPSGQVNVTPRNVPAGTSVKVNQGQVLGTP